MTILYLRLLRVWNQIQEEIEIQIVIVLTD